MAAIAGIGLSVSALSIDGCLSSPVNVTMPLRFICASYGDDVAHKFGRQARQIMQSPLYRAIFPGPSLPRQRKTSSRLRRVAYAYRDQCRRGNRRLQGELHYSRRSDAAGTDSHRAEAKQKLADWYQGVVAQRLLAEGSILVVMHRLAPDDFRGNLQDLGPWHVVDLPSS